MRSVVHVDAVWVSTLKALPTFLVVVPWIAYLCLQKRRVFSSTTDVVWLSVTAIAVQVFGNVAFQWSLSVLGLAISVPMLLGAMLVAGAVVGKLMLNETVGLQKSIAVGTLIVAVVALSYGAHGQSEPPGEAVQVEIEESTPVWMIGLAVIGNLAAGITYAMLGTMMRRSMQGGMSLVATLFVLSSIGTTIVGGWTLSRIGLNGMIATPTNDLITMLLAGVFNALAFFAMAKSLQHASVLFVQMMNASQAAMAAAAGWFIFSEPLTKSVALGLSLTAIGLIVAGIRAKPRERTEGQDPSS